MRRNLLLGLVLSFVGGLTLASCGEKPSEEPTQQPSGEVVSSESTSTPETKKELIVGLECNYAPFNWTENKATESNVAIKGTKTYAEGYDVQIAKIIAEELGYELVIKKMEWDGLIPAVQSNTIDLIIAGMSPTAERLVDIDFTSPYYTSEHVLLVEASSEYANVTSVSQLEGARIAGQIGTLYDDIAHAIPGVVVGGDKPTVPEIVTELTTGIIDGTVLEYPVAQGLVAANPSLKIIQFAEGEGFTQLIDSDTNEARAIEDTDRDVSIGLAKGRDELKTQINEVLANISQDRRNELMGQAVASQQ